MLSFSQIVVPGTLELSSFPSGISSLLTVDPELFFNTSQSVDVSNRMCLQMRVYNILQVFVLLENYKPTITVLGAVLRERITLAISEDLPAISGSTSTI